MKILTTNALALAAVSSLTLGTTDASDSPSAEFEILGRHRVEKVTVPADHKLQPLNMTKTVTLSEGTAANLEVYRIRGTATWPGEDDDSIVSEVTLTYDGENGPVECPRCAYGGDFGKLVEGNPFRMYIKHPGQGDAKSATLTRNYVFIVPDDVKGLTIRITGSDPNKEHALKVPALTPFSPDPSKIRISTQVTGSEQMDSLKTKQLVFYKPEIEATYELNSSAGSILKVKAKIIPDPKISKDIRHVVVSPKDLSIKLPNGQLIRAFGTIVHGRLESSTYTTNIVRNSNGAWPETSEETLLFLVNTKVEKFELLFMPR